MANSVDKIPVEVSLYEKSEKIYPREIKGRFQSLRTLCVFLLLGLYYVLPWLTWDGRQAVLLDLPERKFHIFFLTFWPQDFIFLAVLLIIAGLSLFFFTAVAGRVWCGFACPQTVWTEAFLWMERWVEGSRAQQMKLSAAPWTFTKIRKRFTKQFLWISFSLLTGLTFVGFFEPIRELAQGLWNFEVGGWALFWVIFYGFATYGNAGFMREQVCKYMCPYARFQSAMFDKDTLIVAYDEKRGEPRGRGTKRAKQEEEESAKGDCIDCGICVQVCPTGIDIRDGLQYECIACAACIDGCNEVMTKVGRPLNLIQYSTQAQDQGSDKTLLQTIFRPRVIVYGVLLSAVLIAFMVSLIKRSDLQVDILRDRNALFRWSEDQMIENIYTVRLMNKGQSAQQYSIKLLGLDEASVKWANPSGLPELSQEVGAGKIGDFTVIVKLDPEQQKQRSQEISFEIAEVLEPKSAKVVEESRFWGPSLR